MKWSLANPKTFGLVGQKSHEKNFCPTWILRFRVLRAKFDVRQIQNLSDKSPIRQQKESKRILIPEHVKKIPGTSHGDVRKPLGTVFHEKLAQKRESSGTLREPWRSARTWRAGHAPRSGHAPARTWPPVLDRVGIACGAGAARRGDRARGVRCGERVAVRPASTRDHGDRPGAAEHVPQRGMAQQAGRSIWGQRSSGDGGARKFRLVWIRKRPVLN